MSLLGTYPTFCAFTDANPAAHLSEYVPLHLWVRLCRPAETKTLIKGDYSSYLQPACMVLNEIFAWDL